MGLFGPSRKALQREIAELRANIESPSVPISSPSILADQAARRDRRDDEREAKKPARMGKKDAAAAQAQLLASDSFLDPTAPLPGLKH